MVFLHHWKSLYHNSFAITWQVSGNWCHLLVTVIHPIYFTASDCPPVKRVWKSEPPKLKREKGEESLNSSGLYSGFWCLQKEALKTQPYSLRTKSLENWREEDCPLQTTGGTKPSATLLSVGMCVALHCRRSRQEDLGLMGPHLPLHPS